MTKRAAGPTAKNSRLMNANKFRTYRSTVRPNTVIAMESGQNDEGAYSYFVRVWTADVVTYEEGWSTSVRTMERFERVVEESRGRAEAWIMSHQGSGMMILSPLPSPCGSCPYRRDVASGIWDDSEYLRLPSYDEPTAFQPPYVFLCHQKTGNLCAGWCGTHDMVENLGLRIAAATERISLEVMQAAFDYKTDVPLFASGREACDHGLRDIEVPGRSARLMQASIRRKRRQR